MPHVKGKWAKKDPETGEARKIKLEPWQKFALCSLFGWVKKSNGTRRFTRASLYIPRKNAKSTLASIIGWYLFVMDDEPGAEVYCGATSEKQAWEVFGPSRQMAIKEPDLVTELGVTVNARSLICIGTNSKFEPIIGDPGDGASPHCAIIDEYHEHKTSALYDTMVTGMGAREQPLALIISTAGDNLAGPCREDWKECEEMLLGSRPMDDSLFSVIWTIDKEEEWHTVEGLAKANPNWGISVNPEIYLPMLESAKHSPRKQAAFKTKHLNLWVSAKDAFFNIEGWNNLGNPKIKMEDFIDFPAYIGCDFASKHDLVSVPILFCLPGKKYALFCKHYLPEDTVALPENQHYSAWARGGWITVTGDSITDLDEVVDDVEEMTGKYRVEEVPCDPNRAWGVMTAMQNRGIPVVEYRNTVLTMSEPMKEFDALIRDGRIVHNGDPVLAWAVSNVTGKEDKKGNVYPNKDRSSAKIDPVVASLFALGRAMTRPDESVLPPGFSF